MMICRGSQYIAEGHNALPSVSRRRSLTGGCATPDRQYVLISKLNFCHSRGRSHFSSHVSRAYRQRHHAYILSLLARSRRLPAKMPAGHTQPPQSRASPPLHLSLPRYFYLFSNWRGLGRCLGAMRCQSALWGLWRVMLTLHIAYALRGAKAFDFRWFSRLMMFDLLWKSFIFHENTSMPKYLILHAIITISHEQQASGQGVDAPPITHSPKLLISFRWWYWFRAERLEALYLFNLFWLSSRRDDR